MTNETTVAGIELAGRVVDKLEPFALILALFTILAILVVALLIRKAMSEHRNAARIEDAASSEVIAGFQTSMRMHEGHTGELQALYARMAAMEAEQKAAKLEIDSLKMDAIDLKARIRHLEDALNDLTLHFNNLELDEATRRLNRVTLAAIMRILGAATPP